MITSCHYNIWGYRMSSEMDIFLEQMKSEVDIFAFTEVTDTQNALDEEECFYSDDASEPPQLIGAASRVKSFLEPAFRCEYDTATRKDFKCMETGSVFSNVGFGSMLCWNTSLHSVDHGTIDIPGSEKTSPRILQYLVFEKNEEWYLFAHFHGIWIRGNTKGDDEDGLRIQQSKLVRNSLRKVAAKFNVKKIIVGGDFNLDIDTKALEVLAGDGYRNLIVEHGIKSTRSNLYRYWETNKTMFADYVITSDAVHTKKFLVAKAVDASDHLPLITTFK